MGYRQSKPVDQLRRSCWRAALSAWAAGLLLLLAGCATPVQVERIDPRDVQRELTSNVISTGEISADTQIVLEQKDLWQFYQSNPGAAIALLHRTVTAGQADPDTLFALAEMSFHYAAFHGTQKSDDRAYYLASAVYAYAFLFPDDPAQRPNEFDPRVRTAANIYNRGLTSHQPTVPGLYCVQARSNCRSAVSTSRSIRRAPAGAASFCRISHRPMSCVSSVCGVTTASTVSEPRSLRMSRRRPGRQGSSSPLM